MHRSETGADVQIAWLVKLALTLLIHGRFLELNYLVRRGCNTSNVFHERSKRGNNMSSKVDPSKRSGFAHLEKNSVINRALLVSVGLLALIATFAIYAALRGEAQTWRSTSR